MLDVRMNQIGFDPISQTTLYDVNFDSNMEIIITSTSDMINILNTPEICGLPFQEKMSRSIQNSLQTIVSCERSKIGMFLKSRPIDVIYLLRGGLNFDLHTNLARIVGTLPEVSFLSSQRVESKEGFEIGESEYRKWSIQDNSVLCIGDICATGTTIKKALNLAIAAYKENNKAPSLLLIFTIGTSKVIDTLLEYQNHILSEWSPNFKGICIVFLDGIFNLYERNSILSSTHLPFTDFFRKSTPYTPNLEVESLSSPIVFLERCAIYDGGSRAFEPSIYMKNLRTYWERMSDLSHKIELISLLELKSDLLDYQMPFDKWLQTRAYWSVLDCQILQQMHSKGKEAINYLLEQSLSNLCNLRLQSLPTLD